MTSQLTCICVFAGSRSGGRPTFAQAARDLGAEIARRGCSLVYGGGDVGLMGEVANATLAGGGRVTGVIPEALVQREVGHGDLSELVVVDTMHERKAIMAERADAFVALPGGLGTLEELFEVYTWAQLGIHSKPIGLLDVDGYYRALLGFLDTTVSEGFVSEENRDMLLVAATPAALLEACAQYDPPDVPRWLEARDV